LSPKDYLNIYTMRTMQEIREFAIDLACRAGDLLRDYRQRGLVDDRIRTKTGHFDIVTEADLASERLILAALRSSFPGHGIHAEESARGALPEAEWLWLVDPVDGTTNYAHGLPIFAVNLALAHRGEPMLGVTHDPSTGRTYWAERGGGAWVRAAGEDRRIGVSSTSRIERALLSTGFIAGRKEGDNHNRVEFATLDLKAQSVRRLGSAAMALAWVAAGLLESYWEAGLSPWDFAAGWMLVLEAGGRITQYGGAPMRLDGRSLIASNGQPGIHDVVRETIAAVQAAVR
jgi:myo-inositol-1(or 4)-monophosphatase